MITQDECVVNVMKCYIVFCNMFILVTMYGINKWVAPLPSIKFGSVIYIKVHPMILNGALPFVSFTDLQEQAQSSLSDKSRRGPLELGMFATCLELLWRCTCLELKYISNANGDMASKSLAWHSPVISVCVCGVVLCCCSYLSIEFESADSQVHPSEALISSNGVNLYELVFPYGWAYCSIRLIVVEVEGFL